MCVLVPLLVSYFPSMEALAHTSRRCRTRFTKLFPSAANPFVAKTALSVLGVSWNPGKRDDSQLKHLPSISSLDTVSLSLPRISCNDCEVLSSDSQDGSSIIIIWVKSANGSALRTVALHRQLTHCCNGADVGSSRVVGGLSNIAMTVYMV